MSPLPKALERLEAEAAYSEQLAAASNPERSDMFCHGRAAGIRYAITLLADLEDGGES